MKLQLFDPAMCCSTGVCGPGVDPELTRIASAIFSLQNKGYEVERYNLANDPKEFAGNQTVFRFLEEKGADALPVVLLDGEIAMVSEYPSNDQLATWFDIDEEELKKKPESKPVTIDFGDIK